MIADLNIDYTERRKIRKQFPNLITSVELASFGYNTRKIRLLAEVYPNFSALRVNISGTIKYWFDRDFVYLLITNKEDIYK